MLDELEPGAVTSTYIDPNALKEVLRYDYVSFILLFLYEEEGIELGVPDFHQWIMAVMTGDYEKIAIAIPRDHAKTTIAKLTAVWHFIYSPTRFLVYLSNTSTVAANAVKDIANFITSPMCASIYGEAVFSQREDSRGNYTFFWQDKTIIMRALGAGQQVRGLNVDNKRPDLAVVDDLEKSDESEDNKMGYVKLKKWFYGTFMKSMDRRRNKIIQIGNLTETKSILHDHLTSPYWKSMHMGAFTPDGRVLWPARWTIEQLRADLTYYMSQGQLYNWLSEMLNMPMSESNKLLDPNQTAITDAIYPDSEDIYLRCITVDPAISSTRFAHNAIVAAHVFRDGYWQLAEIDNSVGSDPFELYNRIINMALTWRVNVVGIEDEAYQSSLLYVCRHMAAEAGIHSVKFVPLKTKKIPKHVRINTWAGMIRKGLYRFSINDFALFNRLTEYNATSATNDDDELDCCAYIVQMASTYLKEMMGVMGVDNHQQPTVPVSAVLTGVD